MQLGLGAADALDGDDVAAVYPAERGEARIHCFVYHLDRNRQLLAFGTHLGMLAGYNSPFARECRSTPLSRRKLRIPPHRSRALFPSMPVP